MRQIYVAGLSPTYEISWLRRLGLLSRAEQIQGAAGNAIEVTGLATIVSPSTEAAIPAMNYPLREQPVTVRTDKNRQGGARGIP